LRYELHERIGRGAAGAVYRAREIGQGFAREVCVKRLTFVDPDQARALREEARLLARVRHANVVSMLGVGEEPSGAPYLVLELVRGVDLRGLCRAVASAPAARARGTIGFLPDPVAVHVACGILRAVGAVQRAIPGLVHCDVSPPNILVSNEGEVLLTDFGIALARDRARWTRPSFVKGKLGYMSPEHVRGEELDVRADLFSVGVVLYELLTRRRPWRVGAREGELHASMRGDLVCVSEVRGDLARGLAGAIARLLALGPHERYACADDALRALAPYSAGDGGALRLARLVRELTPAPTSSRAGEEGEQER
jgi:serine/threonine-protein kinase